MALEEGFTQLVAGTGGAGGVFSGIFSFVLALVLILLFGAVLILLVVLRNSSRYNILATAFIPSHSGFKQIRLKCGVVNNKKTEHTEIERGDRNTETWRYAEKLGSLLGDAEDIAHRKQLVIAGINLLGRVWIRKDHIRESLRLELYKSLIKFIEQLQRCRHIVISLSN